LAAIVRIEKLLIPSHPQTAFKGETLSNTALVRNIRIPKISRTAKTASDIRELFYINTKTLIASNTVRR